MNLSYKTHYERPFYIKNIEELVIYYEKLYDKPINECIKAKLSKKTLFTNFEDDYSDLNKIFFEGLRYYHNLNIILFFGITVNHCYHKYTKYFTNDYAIYGIKNIVFENLNQKKSFIYQLYIDKIQNYNDFQIYLNFYNNINNVCVLILRERELQNITYEKYLKTNKKIYYPDNLCKKMLVCGMVFNSTTLDMMCRQNVDKIIENMNETSFKYLKNYRKWLYLNIDIRDHHLFMLFSSVILYTHGLRECNDLDLYVSNLENAYTTNINDKVSNAFILKNGKYDYIDASIKGTSKWKCYWDIWTQEWAELYGVASFDDILIDSNNHYYFCGVKIMILECDIVRRLKRNRPRSIADLHMISQLLNIKIRYPKMPEYIDEYFNINELSKKKQINLLKNGGKITNNEKEILVRKKNIKLRFMGTIKWCLKERYDIDYSIEEIKELFHY